MSEVSGIKVMSGDGCIIATYREEHFSATAELSKMEEGLLFFNRLYVHPKLRCRGIGTALVKTVCERVDEERMNILNCVSAYGDLDETALKSFYSKFGFVEKEDGSLFREYKAT